LEFTPSGARGPDIHQWPSGAGIRLTRCGVIRACLFVPVALSLTMETTESIACAKMLWRGGLLQSILDVMVMGFL
jgi:hypothetical protein